MKVYLAAPYGAREQVRAMAHDLTRIGIHVTSSWLREEHEINKGTVGAAADVADTDVRAHVAKDFDDIRLSDVLVLITESVALLEDGNATSGGRHVETGFALALDKPVIVVGKPENVFHRAGSEGLYSVTAVADWHEAVVHLAALAVSEADNRAREVRG